MSRERDGGGVQTVCHLPVTVCHTIVTGTFARVPAFHGRMNSRAFDHIIERLGSVAAALPDRRTGDNARFAMADFALAAFSVFFTQ